ncbi:MAG TPA: BrnT family toxin, partial [Pyrinomonadaceae bacterium]|nr:BrnT family toxin [Pyrinomonadaceae bacterium]
MKISGFIWLEEIVQKLIWKHSVEGEEVREIFLNKPKFLFIEKGHRKGENVYAAFGKTDAGRYLVCFFVYKKDNRALVLSAREMTDTERKR